MTSYFFRRTFIRKIILFSVVIAGIIALFTPILTAGAQSSAASVVDPCTTFKQDCGGLPSTTTTTGFIGIIVSVINWLTLVGVVVGVLFVVYGAFTMITSIGSPDKFGQGVKTGTNAIIGVAVLLIAFTVVSFVINFITGVR